MSISIEQRWAQILTLYHRKDKLRVIMKDHKPLIQATNFIFNAKSYLQPGEVPDSIFMPQQGVFTRTKIYRQMKDGSSSTTEWIGEAKVRIGDVVDIDTATGRVIVNKMSKKDNPAALIK